VSEKEKAVELLKALTSYVEWDCIWESIEGCNGKCIFSKKVKIGNNSICSAIREIQRELRDCMGGEIK